MVLNSISLDWSGQCQSHTFSFWTHIPWMTLKTGSSLTTPVRCMKATWQQSWLPGSMPDVSATVLTESGEELREKKEWCQDWSCWLLTASIFLLVSWAPWSPARNSKTVLTENHLHWALDYFLMQFLVQWDTSYGCVLQISLPISLFNRHLPTMWV